MELKLSMPNEGNGETDIEYSDDWPEHTRPTMVLAFSSDGQVLQVSDGTWTYHQMSRALSRLLELVVREASLEGGLLGE